MTFVLLIYRSSAGAAAPPAAQAALAGHRALQVESAGRGELHAVAQLGEVRTATSVTHRDGVHDVTDGPYIETKEWLVGFYLVDCDSESTAIERAKQLCPDDSHAIEVRPVTWRWRG
ncbi:MAG TPA: YciI family protein [Kofleriaceae bacterium]|jgi:hypothetical protein